MSTSRRVSPVGIAIQELMTEKNVRAKDIYKGLGKSQSTVWSWLNGTYIPNLYVLPEIERLCYSPHGELLRRAGFVDDIFDVRDDIMNDERIAEPLRAGVFHAYQSAWNLARRQTESMRHPLARESRAS